MSATNTEKKEDQKVKTEADACATTKKVAEEKANTCSTDSAAKAKEEKKGSCCG